MLTVDPRDATPIWKQIEDGVRRLVTSGRLQPGAAVPSVRTLARLLKINPMTVSRSYQQLTQDGVLEVKRGEGTFVAKDALRAPSVDGRRELREAAARYAAGAQALGVPLEEATRDLAAAWGREARKGGRR